MSINLSAAFIDSFDSLVHQQYQANGHQLRGAVRVRPGVVGATHQFPILRPGLATERGAPQTEVQPMNVAWDKRIATLRDYVAPEYSDIFMGIKVNFDEKAELAVMIAKAVGRRADQICIDALNASATSNITDTDVGGLATGMNVPKLRDAKSNLDAADVDTTDRYILVNHEQLRQLLGSEQATSFDYASVKALVQGEINTFMGFRFIQIGNRQEGGLADGAGGATETRAIIWHKMAVGLAEGMAVRTSIDWIPTKVSHLCNAMFSQGAIAIDDLGIGFIDTTDGAEAAAP